MAEVAESYLGEAIKDAVTLCSGLFCSVMEQVGKAIKDAKRSSLMEKF